MNYEMQAMVFGEALLIALIFLGVYARKRIVRLLFQRRRRAHMNVTPSSSSSSVLPVFTAARKDAWEAFMNDKKLIGAYRVTPREIASLRNGSLLGSVTCKEDILFILKTVRGAGRRG
jgi:hypothetical protein